MITSKQRAYLRAMANTVDTIGQIGKEGVTENVIEQTRISLKAREIIKLKVLESAMLTPKEACAILCEAIEAEPVQCIGNRLVLYKANPEKPVIQLPKK